MIRKIDVFKSEIKVGTIAITKNNHIDVSVAKSIIRKCHELLKWITFNLK